jgi:hypothetical protein
MTYVLNSAALNSITDTTDVTKQLGIDLTSASPNTSTTLAFSQTSNRTYNVIDTGTNSSFVMTDGNQTINGIKTFMTPLGVSSGGTGSTVIPSNGQILVGNGTNYVNSTLGNTTGIGITYGVGSITLGNTGVTSITGTPNQVNTNAASGAVILSLPQSIDITNAPTFSQVTISNAPINANDTTNKQYVDNLIAGLSWKSQVVAASTTNIPANYNNGMSGIGATLTNNSVQTVFSIDGYTPNINERVLIKNQTTQLQNGIYVVTDVGSISTNWILTRSTDADVSADFNNATVLVTSGLTQSNTAWTQNQSNPIIGIDNIVFVLFSSTGYTAGTGLLLTGSVFSLKSPVNANLGGTGTTTNPTSGQILVGTSSNTYVPYTLATGTGISTTTGSGTLQINNTGVTAFSAGTTGLTPAVTSTGSVVLGGTLLATNGGTGQSIYAIGNLLYANSTTTLAKLTIGTSGNVLLSNGTVPVWGQVSLTAGVTGILPINRGGTGTGTSPTSGQLLIGNASSGYNLSTLTGTTNQINVTNGSGSITLSTPQNIATTSSVTFANVTVSSLLGSFIYNSSGLLASTGATNGQLLIGRTGNTPVASTLTAGTGIGITNGSGSITIANSGVTSFSAGTTGLTPNVTSTGAITLAGTLAATSGGTGFSSYTAGGILCAATSSTLTTVNDVATGSALLSAGVGNIPTWGKVNLTTTISGILPIANGGTNSSTALNNNRIMISSSGSIIEGSALTNGQVLIGRTGNTPIAGNITAGTGINVINGTGTITIGNTGVTSITGTLNQVIVSGTTTVTLSLPQSIGISNTPTFSQLTISNLPVNPNDTANKQYVDNLISGLSWKNEASAGTLTNLTAIYNNGMSGVGATLTNSGVQAALVIDGYTVSVGNRVLIKNQTTQLQNGIYSVTNVGSVSTNWVLTRTTDANSAGGLNNATLLITNGTQKNTAWTQNVSNPTVGVSNIIFVLFNGSGYSAGSGLTLVGNVFSLTIPVIPALGGTGTSTVPGIGQILIGTNTGNYEPSSVISGPGINIITGSASWQIDNTGVTSFSGGSTGLTPVLASTGSITLGGTLQISNGGTGLTTLGTANQLLGVNNSGSNLEYKSIIAGSGISLLDGPNSLTISTTIGSVVGTPNQIDVNTMGSVVTLSLSSTVNINSLIINTLSSNAFLYSGVGGQIVSTSATDGQLLIGNTSGSPIAANLTAGSGISIVNGSGSITISNTGVTDFSGGLTGLTPLMGTGSVTLGGILNITNGGTGLAATPSSGQLLIGNISNGYNLSTLTAGTGISIINGSGSITVSNTGVTSFSCGTTGLLPSMTSTGAVTITGTLTPANGGTGLTSLGTSNQILGVDNVGMALEYKNVTNSTGISITNGVGSITIGNTGVTSLTGTMNQIDVSASTGGVTLSLPSVVTINGLNLTGIASDALLYSGIGGQITSAIATDGQLLIGNTGGAPVVANLTASTGINITNGPGSITIANSGVTSFNGGTTGLTPALATIGAVTLGGTLNTMSGGTGLSTIGGANTLLGVDVGGTVLEYKTLSAGPGITITPSPGDIQIDSIINVVLDDLAVPTYPTQPQINGVWYGSGTAGSSSATSVLLGNNATQISGQSNVVIGYNADADSSIESVVIGAGTSTGGNSDAVIIGYNASGEQQSIAVGESSIAKPKSVAIGSGANSNDNAIAIGIGATTAIECVSIGTIATTAKPNSVAVGFKSNNTGVGAVTVGSSSYSGADYTIAIGNGAIANLDNAISIGSGATASALNSVAIGAGIVANQTGGLFAQHRGPGVYSVNPAGFIAGTNELVEVKLNDGQLIIGNTSGTASLATLTAGTAIGITNGAGAITITNTGVTSFSGGTTGLTPVALSTGAVTLGGTLAVGSGGTGQSTLSAGALLLGNGTSAISTLADVAVGSALTSGGVGSNPTWTNFSSSAVASTLMSRDANANTSINNIIQNLTSTPTAAGTTTLTATSTYFQLFTGSTTQIVSLPVSSVGLSYYIINNSTGAVTVNASGGSTVISLTAGQYSILTSLTTAGTTAASWYATTSGSSGPVMDTNATPTYPTNLTKGVWYGLNTKANAYDSTSITMGTNSFTTGINAVAIGNAAGANQRSISIGDQAASNAFPTALNIINLGYQSGLMMRSNGNISIGYQAMTNNSMPIGTYSNTTIGYQAGFAYGLPYYGSGTASYSGGYISGTGTAWSSALNGGLIIFNSNGVQAPLTTVFSTTFISTTYSGANIAATSYQIYFGTLYNTGTVSQSGTTITGVGTAWTTSMIGGYLIYTTTQTSTAVRIRNVSSATSISTDFSQTVASTSYNIYYVPSNTESTVTIGSGSGYEVHNTSKNVFIGDLSGASMPVVGMNSCVSIGYASTVNSSNSVAIGNAAIASQAQCVSLGDSANTGASSAVAIGKSASATGNSAVAIGASATASSTYAVAIGPNMNNSVFQSVLIGTGGAELFRMFNYTSGNYSFRLASPVATLTGSSVTPTVAQLVGGYINMTGVTTFNIGTSGVTGPNISAYSQITSNPYVGLTFRCIVVNNDSFTISGTSGSKVNGITPYGRLSSLVSGPNSRILTFYCTSTSPFPQEWDMIVT